MSLPTVLHPDVVDFLRQDVETHFRERVWKCLKKLQMRQFDNGLRVKKLNGITKRVWEARVNQGCRLIFTYEKSQQPETRKPQAYIAVQDICLDHDDVSRRARARNETPDAQWLDAEVIETIGSFERDRYTLDDREKAALEAEEAEDLSHDEIRADELLGNIPWRVLESEEQWQQAIVSADADLPLKLTPQEFELVKLSGNLLLSGSAGTGKTTVAVYRLLQNLSDSLSGKRLYVAYNPLLVSNAQEQFKKLIGKQKAETEGFFQFKTIRNLCLKILEASGEPHWCQDEVDFQVFDELYRGHPKRQSFPSTLIWDEIRSIIKGSQLSPHVKALSKKDYENLGKKRSTVIDKNQRYEVYKLAEWYDKKLKNDGNFDEIDLARNVLQIVKKDETIRYQLIVW
jgi:Superfamily I DNA and RNA helicases